METGHPGGQREGRHGDGVYSRSVAGDGIRPAAEGVAADPQGNIYGAEVGPKDVKKYVKK